MKKWCKSRKKNEIQFKQNKIYGNKYRQRKARRCIRISESRKHAKNRDIQIFRNHKK